MRILAAALGIACITLLSACPDSKSTGPDDDDDDDNGNQNATVNLEIRGLTGAEGAMEVRYTIADGIITRAQESVIPRASLLQYCTTVGTSVNCPITVPVGKTVTFYAYEGYEGIYSPTATAFTIPKAAHEFVTFSGDCAQSGGLIKGDCATAVTQAKTYNVRADFTSMPEFRVMIHGATSFDIDVEVRDLLQMPVVNRSPTPGAGGGTAGTQSLSAIGWFPFGTEITLEAKAANQAQFIRWEGCKTGTGGTNPVCVVPQSTSGGAPAVVRLFNEYWQCPIGPADGPGTNCTKVRP